MPSTARARTKIVTRAGLGSLLGVTCARANECWAAGALNASGAAGSGTIRRRRG
jgi:hypothetical protein